jgi:hypothetical protein
MKEIVSFPGGRLIGLPTSSHKIFSSLPEMTICEVAVIGNKRNATLASVAIMERLSFMAASRSHSPPSQGPIGAILRAWSTPDQLKILACRNPMTTLEGPDDQ